MILYVFSFFIVITGVCISFFLYRTNQMSRLLLMLFASIYIGLHLFISFGFLDYKLFRYLYYDAKYEFILYIFWLVIFVNSYLLHKDVNSPVSKLLCVLFSVLQLLACMLVWV